jgi:DNA-binding transcriptional LysR family regulator
MPQGVQLTEQGQVLLAQAERWLGDESALRAALQQTGGGAGTLRLGIMECLVPYILPGLEEAGPAALKVSVGDTGTLVGQLCRNEIDALLAFNVPRLPELRVYDERSYDLGVVYAAALAPSGEPPFRIENCLGRPLCLPDTSLSVWPRLDAEVYRIHAEPRIALRSNSIALIMEYVAAGKGISFLTWLDAAAGVAEGRFHFAKLENRRLSEKLYLCAAANAPLGPLQAACTRALFRCVPLSPQAD